MNHPYQQVKKHRFYTEDYTLRWCKAPLRGKRGKYGYINSRKKIMYICPVKDREEFLDSIIHESLHALVPFLSHDAIYIISAQISSLIWKAGYRFPSDYQQMLLETSKVLLKANKRSKKVVH